MTDSANTFNSLKPLMKDIHPTKTERKERFSRIRNLLRKKKNG